MRTGPGDVSLHPAVDAGRRSATRGFDGGTLRCRCPEAPVLVAVRARPIHVRLCGCTRCWRTEGTLFALAATVPADAIEVIAEGGKLEIVDPSVPIHRYTCVHCETHMYGEVEPKRHPFAGEALIHPELFETPGWPPPTCATFCASTIDGGLPPEKLPAIRARLAALRLPAYDCHAPDRMEQIAAFRAREAGLLP
ncbi:GFA family protein [Roseivivax jejudonensis]|uniref:GFA family protein n=1 Tax=Roseivivax jejudonensis TaxID=1529041 RepID=UPI0013564CE0|nr:GFA family protein [Roseivivax jejudonensis]